MRLLTVRHVTIYRYSEPVGLGEHRMMFRPRESHDLRLISHAARDHAQPAHLRWLHDVFDNSVAVATFEGSTCELRFRQHCHAGAFRNSAARLPAGGVCARRIRSAIRMKNCPISHRALVAHYPSDEPGALGSQFLDPSGTTGTMNLLRSMTRGIKEDFVYTRRSREGRADARRDAAEPPRQLPGLRRAHDGSRAFAGPCRSLRQRLHLRSRAGDTGGTGGGATHAWMQAYLPGAGWIDFDPTNSIVGNRNLIRVAVAWTPDQVMPLSGTYEGSPEAFTSMDVSVTVTQDVD